MSQGKREPKPGYISTEDAARNWGCTSRAILFWLKAGRIPGALRIGRTWLVPVEAIKPPRTYRGEVVVKP